MEISVRVERRGRAGTLPGWCRSGGVRLLADPVVGAIASLTTAMQGCCDDIRATIILALRDDQPGDDPQAAGRLLARGSWPGRALLGGRVGRSVGVLLLDQALDAVQNGAQAELVGALRINGCVELLSGSVSDP